MAADLRWRKDGLNPSEKVVAFAGAMCAGKVRDIKVVGIPSRGLIIIRPYVYAPPTTMPQRLAGIYGVSRRFVADEDWLLQWAERRLAERHNLPCTDDDSDTVVYSLEADDDESTLCDSDSDFDDDDRETKAHALAMYANHTRAIFRGGKDIAVSIQDPWWLDPCPSVSKSPNTCCHLCTRGCDSSHSSSGLCWGTRSTNVVT